MKCDFGKTLDSMDIEAFLNMRDWFEAAITNHGGKIIDGGMGVGRADIGVELDGVEFGVQIRPRPIGGDGPSYQPRKCPICGSEAATHFCGGAESLSNLPK